MVLPGTFSCFRHWGLRVGQTVDPQFDPLGIVLKSNKKHPKSSDFGCFLELLGGFELLKAIFQRGFPLRLALCFNGSVVFHGILSPALGIA